MHDHRTPSPEQEDASAQQAVLGLLLEEHPALLTTDEVEREIGRSDAVERASRDLVGAGLLHRHGEFVLPTRAARYLSLLDCG